MLKGLSSSIINKYTLNCDENLIHIWCSHNFVLIAQHPDKNIHYIKQYVVFHIAITMNTNPEGKILYVHLIKKF